MPPSLLLITLLLIPFVAPAIVDLSGSGEIWRFRSQDGNYSGSAHHVPGDIYADLQAAGLIDNPLYVALISLVGHCGA